MAAKSIKFKDLIFQHSIPNPFPSLFFYSSYFLQSSIYFIFSPKFPNLSIRIHPTPIQSNPPFNLSQADKSYVIVFFLRTQTKIIISILIRPMNYANHDIEFSLRLTMPSKSNRLILKKNQTSQQGRQKPNMDLILQKVTGHDTLSNCFFVRISKESLEDQKRIYKWRMNCSGNFINISNFKLQSEGNCYNPNLLYKIDLPIPRSNFVQVKDLCLTKCVVYLKSALRGVKILFQYFEPIVFTDKMVFITQQGEAKIWMDERFYINPGNEIYDKNIKKTSVSESLHSIFEIFKQKCLKTKLTAKLFTSLEKCIQIQDSLLAIQNFQLQESLFPIQGLKNSVSTGYGLGTSSLEFQGSRSLMKKKSIDLEGQKKKNTASQKFFQAKSMQIKSYETQVNNSRQEKVIYKSQNEVKESPTSIQQQLMVLNKKPNTFLNVNPEKPGQSIVISQLFNSNVQMFADNKKREQIQIHSQKFKFSCQQSIAKSKLMMKSNQDLFQSGTLENDNSQVVQKNMEAILFKNGWSTNLTSLFEKQNVNQSFIQGKDETIPKKGLTLKKLHKMGKQVRQSILPVDQQFED